MAHLETCGGSGKLWSLIGSAVDGRGSGPGFESAITKRPSSLVVPCTLIKRPLSQKRPPLQNVPDYKCFRLLFPLSLFTHDFSKFVGMESTYSL